MASSADAVTAALQRELLFFSLWLALLTGGSFFGTQINANSHDVPLLIMENHSLGDFSSPPPSVLSSLVTLLSVQRSFKNLTCQPSNILLLNEA